MTGTFHWIFLCMVQFLTVQCTTYSKDVLKTHFVELCGKCYGDSSKKLNRNTVCYIGIKIRRIRKKRNTICSAVPLLGTYSIEVKTGTWTDICTPMLIGALFTKAKKVEGTQSSVYRQMKG